MGDNGTKIIVALVIVAGLGYAAYKLSNININAGLQGNTAGAVTGIAGAIGKLFGGSTTNANGSTNSTGQVGKTGTVGATDGGDPDDDGGDPDEDY